MPKKKKRSIKYGKNNKTKKILDNAKPEFYFRLVDGSELKNLFELTEALNKMSEDTFYFHVNGQKNDFNNWIKDIFEQEELADEISKHKNKLEMEVHMLRFLVKELVK